MCLLYEMVDLEALLGNAKLEAIVCNVLFVRMIVKY